MNAHNLLQLSEDTYDLMVLSFYLSWCKGHSSGEQDLQKLMTNQPLLEWFIVEYRKLEHSFLSEITPYIRVATHKDCIATYDRNIRKIYLHFNTPLIEAAKKET